MALEADCFPIKSLDENAAQTTLSSLTQINWAQTPNPQKL